MKIKLLEEVEITEYEKVIGTELEVAEMAMSRNYSGSPFKASFPGVRIVVGDHCERCTASGNTINEALIGLARIMSNEQIKTPNGLLFAPKLIHTKIITQGEIC